MPSEENEVVREVKKVLARDKHRRSNGERRSRAVPRAQEVDAETRATESRAAQPSDPAVHDSQWPSRPTDKEMGLIRLTLDKGVKTTAIGHLYGLDFEIEGKGFHCRIFFDYYNRRLKVIDYEATDYRALVGRIVWLGKANEFDKIFLKAHEEDWQKFLELGFMLEGILKYYFRGENAYVLSKFSSVQRVTSPHLIEESDLIESLMRGQRGYTPAPMPEGYRMVVAREEHIPALVNLYRRVFKTYPSPLTHPDYVLQTMRRNILYRAVLDPKGDVVSAASAEIDAKHANAELTDCATKRAERGKGHMYHLLRALEEDLLGRGIVTGYTLARARSGGMNRVFYRLGYEYSGRLVNNCDIYGQFEDMNIWVRRLDREPGA